jgi:hypothetical protein
MLTHATIVPYLLARNLLSTRTIVEDDLSVAEVSRRNVNYKVSNAPGPPYFVKQGMDRGRAATVDREAAVYDLVHARGARGARGPGRGFQRYLPRTYGHDPAEHVLVLEFYEDAEDLQQYHYRLGRFPVRVAAWLGEALGRLHREYDIANVREVAQFTSPYWPPPVFTLHRPQHHSYGGFSTANLQLIRIIQHFPEFSGLLEQLRDDWLPQTLIHGDAKWSNCLVLRPPRAENDRLKILDWEFAALGDPCWDAGTILAEYLSFWLLSVPIAGDEQPGQYLHLARYPLAKMQPAIRAFWRAYSHQMHLDMASSSAHLLKSVRYAAARLVLTAFEQMQTASQISGTAIYFLQLGFNILQRPAEAATQLLGMRLEQASAE